MVLSSLSGNNRAAFCVSATVAAQHGGKSYIILILKHCCSCLYMQDENKYSYFCVYRAKV